MNYPIPILLYHRIDESITSTSIAPSVFRKHLETLKEQGWKSLCAAEFESIISGRRRVPEKSFLITFDDGYESVESAALDVLKDLNFSAICYLVSGFLNGTRANPESRSITATPELFMTWEQVRKLQSSGLVDCQSHTHTHSRFGEFSSEAIRQDLDMSISVLSEELALPRKHFVHFAWPWGKSFPEWRAIASDCGFKYQYGVARQSFRMGANLDQIPRICFDAHSLGKFQRQFWLQTGQMSSMWDFIYPHGQRVRRAFNI